MLHILTADPNLGRVDPFSFSDQTLMEMVIADFPETEQRKLQDKQGNFLDVCDWGGIFCDDSQEIYRIEYAFQEGPIELKYIPATVRNIILPISALSGTLETILLPPKLEEFSMGDSKLRGTVDFTQLPSQMAELSIYSNLFSGSAVLDSLPDSLQRMWIKNNAFSGTLCLTTLPPKMQILDVSRNAFTGEFRLENAPMSLHSNLMAMQNSFSAIAVVPKDFVARLGQSGVTAVVDEDGNPHPSESEMVERSLKRLIGAEKICKVL